MIPFNILYAWGLKTWWMHFFPHKTYKANYSRIVYIHVYGQLSSFLPLQMHCCISCQTLPVNQWIVLQCWHECILCHPCAHACACVSSKKQNGHLCIEILLHCSSIGQKLVREADIFLLCLFHLPPVLSPDRKRSPLRPQHRERAGLIKSAWSALTRLQAVTTAFSPVAAARSSSREQWKVQSHKTSLFPHWFIHCLRLAHSSLICLALVCSKAGVIMILSWKHDHYKVKDGDAAN